jgi:hypothetical protein
VASELTKRALAETKVEASTSEVARTIKEGFAIIEVSFIRENMIEKAQWAELYGKRGMSLRSWGEKIKVEIRGDGISGSIVRAESKATLKTTIFDYGQNKENLERIFAILTSRYKNTSPVVIKEKTF